MRIYASVSILYIIGLMKENYSIYPAVTYAPAYDYDPQDTVRIAGDKTLQELDRTAQPRRNFDKGRYLSVLSIVFLLLLLATSNGLVSAAPPTKADAQQDTSPTTLSSEESVQFQACLLGLTRLNMPLELNASDGNHTLNASIDDPLALYDERYSPDVDMLGNGDVVIHELSGNIANRAEYLQVSVLDDNVRISMGSPDNWLAEDTVPIKDLPPIFIQGGIVQESAVERKIHLIIIMPCNGINAIQVVDVLLPVETPGLSF